MSPKYLVVALVAAVAAAPLHAQSVKAGIDAWQRADYPHAVSIWRPLAEGGDADAQFNLGQAYRLGRGVPLDLAAAKIWFERAARKRPSRRPDDSRSPDLPERRPRRGPQMAQAGRRPRRAARDAGLRDRAIQRRRSDAGSDPAAIPLSAAPPLRGLQPAQETLDQLNQLMPAADRQKAMALRSAQADHQCQQVASAKAPTPTPASAQASVGQGDIDAAQGSLPHRRRRRPGTGGSSSAPSRSAARPKRFTSACRARPRSRDAALIISPAARSPGCRSARLPARQPPPRRAARSESPASPSPRAELAPEPVAAADALHP